VPIAILEISTGSNDQEGSSAMLFIDNKYTRWYYQIITTAQQRSLTGYTEEHHIIPKSLNGSNDSTNLVLLTAREHLICHMLLTKMVTGKHHQKMIHAWWAMATLEAECQDRHRLTSRQYETVRKAYSEYFSKNNPMKDPVLQQKRVDTWRANRAAKDYIPPRVLKDKFITPYGIFKTKKAIQKVVGIPEWTLNTIYNDLDAYPATNGRASKKINHLNINPTKTWRDNGFGYL
jgi:hypothetical protein